MRLVFADEAWDDYLYWQKNDKRMVERINKLKQETQREPFAGIGKPEALKQALSGFWSRRITDEHRMMYRVEGDAPIAQLRFHYYASMASALRMRLEYSWTQIESKHLTVGKPATKIAGKP